MKIAYAVCATVIAVSVGTCVPLSSQGQEAVAAPKLIRIEGNELGVPWLDLVKALRPTLDLSSIRLTTTDWVVPWKSLQKAASDTSVNSQQTMKVIMDSAGKPTAIEVDPSALSTHSAQWKQEFAESRAAMGGKPAYRFEPVNQTESTSSKRRVLVIAGYQSQPNEALSVAQYLHDRSSLPCETFSYPTDGAIDNSAKKLAEILAIRHQESPQVEWTIVSHSMGGIVGRAAIELYEAKGVKHLIQIFPPNHGSVLAEIAEPLDGLMIAKSQIMRIFSSFDGGSNDSVGKAVAPAAVLTWMSEGFGLASRDLCPESAFLQQLNNRKRSSSVDYTVLIGTGGPLRPLVGSALLVAGPMFEQQLATQQEMDEIRKAWKWVERIVRDGQLIQGRGDGVVSTVSAQLAGVTDTTTISCNHIAWSALQTESGKRVMDEVLKRIQASR